MLKLQNVPLNQIVASKWRDEDLYPIDEDHVAELKESITDHGFFSSVIGRRQSGGKIEIACGHARVAAARKARLDTIPIFVGDLDDDAMLRALTDENALQGGSSPGAIINEIAAVTRRIVDGLLEDVTGVARDAKLPAPLAKSIRQAFNDQAEIEKAFMRLIKRASDPDASVPIGTDTIRLYLGQGDPQKAHRSEKQIRETLGALRQSGRYDAIINDAIAKHPIADEDDDDTEPKDTAIIKRKSAKPKPRLLDDRVANVFQTDQQFHAFREAVTTSAAQKAIPVNQQITLAKEIMRPKYKDAPQPKQVTAGKIKAGVQERVNDYMKEQRKIDKEERDAYLAEQMEVAIDHELTKAGSSLRSLIGSIATLMKLAEKYPAHPKIGGFSAKLDDLVDTIKQFGKKLK